MGEVTAEIEQQAAKNEFRHVAEKGRVGDDNDGGRCRDR